MHSAYLYNRYKEFHKDYLTNPERTKHLKKIVNKLPLIIISFLILLVLILVFYSEPTVLFFGLFLLAASLSYSYSKGLKNLTKRIPGFKSIFVSLMWASLPAFLVFYYSAPVNIALFLMIVFVFLRLLINTIAFDIKDVKSDEEEGLLTLAIILDKKNIIKLLIFLDFLSIIPIITGILLNYLPFYSIILIIFTSTYALFALSMIRNEKISHNLSYNVIIDAELFLWSSFILLGRFLI
jgi:4-hydroxybenzoate polyprenyltransferase